MVEEDFGGNKEKINARNDNLVTQGSGKKKADKEPEES